MAQIVQLGAGDCTAARWKVTSPLRLRIEGIPVADLNVGDLIELLTLEAEIEDCLPPSAIWPAIRRGDLTPVEAP